MDTTRPEQSRPAENLAAPSTPRYPSQTPARTKWPSPISPPGCSLTGQNCSSGKHLHSCSCRQKQQVVCRLIPQFSLRVFTPSCEKFVPVVKFLSFTVM